MNARLLVLPFLVSAAACATEAETADMAQIGSRAVPAKATLSERGALDWAVVRAHLSELGVDRVASIFEFAPEEGLYAFGQQLVRVDECGIEEGSLKIDHDIQQVDARTGTYQDHAVARGEPEPISSVGCELDDHTFRCNGSSTTIDFKALGLAAEVTIQNDSFGIWSGSSPSFIGAFVYTVSCEGADCGKSPASDLFGTLSRPMPCIGIEAARFQK